MNRGSRRTTEIDPSGIDYVQIDGLVVLKLIKHCTDESDVVQGVLLGVGVDNRLEITNCFPFPRHVDDDEFDEQDYQIDMMRYLRQVNIDHLHVGWYQSSAFASHMSKILLDSQFMYQNAIEESVVVIYDPLKTSRGFLSIRAFKLSPAAMQLFVDQDFSFESVKNASLRFDNFLTEIKVVVKNSHLINALLCEMADKNPRLDGVVPEQLDLATSSVLEKGLHSMMDSIDDLCQESHKYVQHQKQLVKQQANKLQHQQKKTQENAARQAKGEAPLPEEDLNKLFKPPPPFIRFDGMITAGQVNTYARQINQFSSQALGKMFVASSLQTPNLQGKSTLTKLK